MKSELELLSRRKILGSAVLSLLAAAFPAGVARAAQVYLELQDPALMVHDPSGVFLVAGTQAGTRYLAAGEEGVIIYSDDAGQTWKQAAVPVSVTITCLAFVSPTQGWATGGYGVILHTQDGGATWEKQLDGLQAIDLMTAATQAFVSARPAGDDTAARAGRRADILAQQGPDKPFLSILPVSAQEVLVFGAYRMVVRTTDGGKTWQDWSFHIGDPLSHNLYCAAAIGGKYYAVGETGLVFCSTDGGQSFPQLAQPTIATLFGICDAGGGAMVIYGVAGEIFNSTDGGKTWTASAVSSSSDITSIVKLPSGELIASDESGLLYTSQDQGKTFAAVAKSPQILISDIVPVGSSGLILLSAIGVIPLNLAGT